MTYKTAPLHSIDFDDATELAGALIRLIEIARGADRLAVVYADSDGFGANGTATLIERTLTDGSLVYDIEIRDR